MLAELRSLAAHTLKGSYSSAANCSFTQAWSSRHGGVTGERTSSHPLPLNSSLYHALLEPVSPSS